MTNAKMDAIQVEDAVVGEERTLSPRFILLSECLVETTHRAGAGRNPHQGVSDFSDFVGARATHKHLGQCFGHLWFIAVVALEHLRMECSFPISGHLEILNAPCWGHQIAGGGTIAIASAIGRAFSPRCSDALLQLFTHDLFDQDLDCTHGKAPYMLTKLLLLWQGGFRRLRC